TRVVSVYFDCADGRFAEAALRTPEQSLKLRTKEYVPDLGHQGPPRCVVDVKRQRGEVITKHSSWVSRSAVRAIFCGSAEEALAFGADALAAHASVRTATGGEPLRPVVAVSYLRTVYQGSSELRITVDRELAFHRGDTDLLLGPEPVTAKALGRPVARDGRVIVEVKHVGETAPGWIEPLLRDRRTPFSKFGAAMTILGER
ncbi:MAG: VTC domain-containing protein, partial [Myxococcales bacterium]